MHPDDLLATPHVLFKPPRVGRLRLRWLGTAGFELRAGRFTILIDPYLSRVGLGRFLTGPITVDRSEADRSITDADAIFVGHSHFDHVLDVPYLARRTGAFVIGSESTANLMACCGLPPTQVHTCRGGETFEFGPFRVTMVPSEHSRFALGRVPYAGDIPCCCDLPLRGRDYRCGQVFGIAIEVGGLTIYHVGSANLVDDAIRHRNVDLLLMCISGRHATERYVPRLLAKLAPRVVVPMHYDNFFRPMGAGLSLLPLTRFGRLVDEVRAFDRQIAVRTLPLEGAVHLA